MARKWVAIVFGAAILLAALVMVGIGTLFVVSLSPGDARYMFSSPSGVTDLYLLENCEQGSCSHQAVIESPGGDGNLLQIRCGLDIDAREPVFGAVDVQWTPREDGVLLDYGTEVEAKELAINFTRDCTG